MAVARPTIGIFAGIFNEEGKLLLRRRDERNSIAHSEAFEGEWELPGGGVEEENNGQAADERIISAELAREVQEEVGISISIPTMPAMFPAVLRGGADWAFVIPIGICAEKPTAGQTTYVSPQQLRNLAERPRGERLISGWGNRMSRLALMALSHSPNAEYQVEAYRMLLEIQEGWS